MLKGVNRNVIVVRGGRNSRFETVYFVVKKGIASGKEDIVKEANRIIVDGNSSCGVRGFDKLKCILAGIMAGAVVASALWIVGILLL